VVPREKSKYMESFKDWERAEILAGRCPDCGGTQFREGPSGGISTNWVCDNEACGSRFNIAPVGPGATLGLDLCRIFPRDFIGYCTDQDLLHAGLVKARDRRRLLRH
jgi:hypothetical protein